MQRLRYFLAPLTQRLIQKPVELEDEPLDDDVRFHRVIEVHNLAGRSTRNFDRLHSRAEYDGTGISLALCERIVERGRLAE